MVRPGGWTKLGAKAGDVGCASPPFLSSYPLSLAMHCHVGPLVGGICFDWRSKEEKGCSRLDG